MKKYLNSLVRFEILLCIISLSLMTVITFINVVSRKMLHLSLSYTEEITGILFVVVTMIGAALSARSGKHLGLSVLTDRLPRKANKIIIIISLLAAVSFSVVLIYQGYIMVCSEFIYKQKTSTLGWPEWIYGLSMPLGGLILLVHFIEYGINCLKEDWEGRLND